MTDQTVGEANDKLEMADDWHNNDACAGPDSREYLLFDGRASREAVDAHPNARHRCFIRNRICLLLNKYSSSKS
jgi:hypothetical protein